MPAPKGYKAIFIKFMSFFDGTTYEGDAPPAFSIDHLLSITDVDIVRYLTIWVYGKTEVEEGDKPKLRASTLGFFKKAISHYMPRGAMTWDDINQKGNPTKSAAVNAFIKKVELHEVRGSGVKPSARRAFEWEEFMMVIIATRQLFSDAIACTLLAVMTLQWQMIGRIDDVMKLATSTVLKHPLYPFVLNIKMCWSKNIRMERESPTQILLASMNPLICPFLHLAIFIETVGAQRGGAQHGGFMFGNTNRNTSALISKILTSRFFKPAIPMGKLGTHSIRKGAATFCSRNGIPRDWIQQRGRWRGQRKQVDTYIDGFQPYPDARVAACLCGVRGACKYVFKDGTVISNEFLESITPHACEVFGVEVARVLALPLIWAAYEQQVSFEGHDIPIIGTRFAQRIKAAWIRAGGTPEVNPITRVRLAMQQFGDQLRIVPLHHDDIDGDGVDGGGGGGGGGGGIVFDSEAYFSQLFVMQQRTEDLRTEVLAAIAECKRYMQVVNTNIKRTSQFQLRPVTSSSNVSACYIFLFDYYCYISSPSFIGCFAGKCIRGCLCWIRHHR